MVLGSFTIPNSETVGLDGERLLARRTRRRWWVVSVVVLFLLCVCGVWTAHTWGIRTSVTPDDYRVVRTILQVPRDLELTIERARVRCYKPFLIPSPDVMPEDYPAIYQITAPDGDPARLLNCIPCEERDLQSARLLAEFVRRHFKIGEVERYLTCSSPGGGSDLFICVDRGKRSLYILTSGVGVPGVWAVSQSSHAR